MSAHAKQEAQPVTKKLLTGMGRWIKALAAAWIATISCAALAQDVHDPDRGGPLSFLRSIEKAADAAGVKEFPRLSEDQPGTVVHLFFDYDDWDIVFMTYNTVPKEALVGEAKRFAAAIGMPLADYYVFKGTKYLRVDVELNDYLPATRGPRRIEFDVAEISKQLSAMKSLPQPVWFVLEPEDADTTIVRRAGREDEEIDEPALFRLGSPESPAAIVQGAEIPWYAIPVLLCVGSMFILAPLSVARQMLKRRPSELHDEPGLLSPEEVQKQYEENRKWSWLIMAPLLLGLPLAIFAFSKTNFVLDKSFRAIPSGAGGYLLAAPLSMVLVLGVAFIVRAVRDKRDPQPERAITPEARQMKFLGKILFVPMLFIVAFILMRIAYPGWATALSPLARRVVALALPFGMGVFFIFSFYRFKKQTHIPLPTDSPYRQFAINTSARLGVKLRDVFQFDADHINAMATLNSKIGLTTGLLTKMEPNEINTVIAHEIGHQRAKHVRTFFILSLCILIPLIGLHYLLAAQFPNAHPLLRSPLLVYPLVVFLPHLILGARRRKAEHEADLFAVEVLGDPELVIRTLHKLAHLNQTPTKLIGVDEKLSSHPSIANRERAIREIFGVKMDADDQAAG